MPEPDDRPDDRPDDLAEDRPDDRPGGTGRDKLTRAALRPSRRQLVVAVVLALVGYGVVVQVRATDADSDYDTLRQQDLIDVLNGLAGTTQRTQSEIERLTRTREQLLDDTSARGTALQEARDEVDTLTVLAGLVPVTGPGIRITVTEGDAAEVSLSSMLDLVQELRTVGAEAIQLNGEVRVVAQTSFEDVEGGLLVDGTLVEAPYVVDVIGEPGVLSGAVEFALGPRAQIEGDGASLEVTELGSLDVDAVAEQQEAEYTVPDADQ